MASKHTLTTLNISLPDKMRSFVERMVAKGSYTSASEYLRELIRKAQQETDADVYLQNQLLEGLDSGPGIPITAEYWDRKRSKHFGAAEKKKR